MKNTWVKKEHRKMVRAQAIGKDGLRFSENTFFEAKLLLFSGNGNVKKRTQTAWEVFAASKYKRWIDFQHPLPLSDL